MYRRPDYEIIAPNTEVQSAGRRAVGNAAPRWASLGYPRLPSATLSNPRPPMATLGRPRLPSATLGYPRLPSSALGYPSLPSATLVYPRLPSATLGYPRLHSATLGYPRLPTATPGHPRSAYSPRTDCACKDTCGSRHRRERNQTRSRRRTSSWGSQNASSAQTDATSSAGSCPAAWPQLKRANTGWRQRRVRALLADRDSCVHSCRDIRKNRWPQRRGPSHCSYFLPFFFNLHNNIVLWNSIPNKDDYDNNNNNNNNN